MTLAQGRGARPTSGPPKGRASTAATCGRRQFGMRVLAAGLTVLGGLALPSAVFSLAACSSERAKRARSWGAIAERLVRRRRAASLVPLGEAYRARAKQAGGSAELVAALAWRPTDPSRLGALNDEALETEFERLVRTDYARANLVSMAGWLVAPAEAALCCAADELALKSRPRA